MGKLKDLTGHLWKEHELCLADGEVDKTFWGETIRTAVYLLNHSPMDVKSVHR